MASEVEPEQIINLSFLIPTDLPSLLESGLQGGAVLAGDRMKRIDNKSDPKRVFR